MGLNCCYRHGYIHADFFAVILNMRQALCRTMSLTNFNLSARGSSKPLPYGVEINFEEKNFAVKLSVCIFMYFACLHRKGAQCAPAFLHCVNRPTVAQYKNCLF